MPTHDDYRIGWICALPIEMATAQAMLDTIHPILSNQPDDKNTYVLGNIGPHNIVIACLPAGWYGTTSATVTALRMRYSYKSIEFCLMVGIGGGAPSTDNDIRLGDVIVSKPVPKHGGVIQYDYGKVIEGGQFLFTGTSSRPPEALLKVVSRIQAEHTLHRNRIQEHYEQAVNRYPLLKKELRRPAPDEDRLFVASYRHESQTNDCKRCDKAKVQNRETRLDHQVRVFYGLIASANQVMRNANTRDTLAREHGILCFEMEAAGLVDVIPYLVIRGVCDYSDSHKTKQWQGYAAATAAAYAKELTLFVPFHDQTANLLTPEHPIQWNRSQNAVPSQQQALPASPSHHSQPTMSAELPASVQNDATVPSIQEADSTPRQNKRKAFAGSLNQDLNVFSISNSNDSHSGYLKSCIIVRRVFEENKSVSKAHGSWQPWPGDCVNVFHAVKHWLSSPQSSLLILAAESHAYARVKDLTVELLAFMMKQNGATSSGAHDWTTCQVLWTLSMADPCWNDPIEVLKSLLERANRTFAAVSQLDRTPFIQAEDEEKALWNLLRGALMQNTIMYVLVESRNVEFTRKMLHLARELVSVPASQIKFLVTVPNAAAILPIYHDCSENIRAVRVPPVPPQASKLQSRPKKDITWSNLAQFGPRILSSRPKSNGDEVNVSS